VKKIRKNSLKKEANVNKSSIKIGGANL